MTAKGDKPARGAGSEHRIGQLDDFPPHQIVAVKIEGRTIGVVRKDNAVHAFANRCPHHGAPMCAGRIGGAMLPSGPDEYRYGLDGLVVRCPWHAYEFNVETGESIGGIMRARLPVYHTEVRGNDVFCRLSGRKRDAAVTPAPHDPEEIGYGPD